MTDNEIKELFLHAEAEAARTSRATLEQYGHGPCGFAWVVIRPARGRVIRLLKEMNLGAKAEVGGGWLIWNPGREGNQCMNAKETGANAFAKILREPLEKLNMRIDVRTQVD